MGFGRWLSVADFFALIPIIERNGGLGVSSLLLSLIEFHGGSAEKWLLLEKWSKVLVIEGGCFGYP